MILTGMRSGIEGGVTTDAPLLSHEVPGWRLVRSQRSLSQVAIGRKSKM